VPRFSEPKKLVVFVGSALLLRKSRLVAVGLLSDAC